MVKITRKFSVSDGVASELSKRFPEVTFVLDGSGHHPHPIGALERAVCEAELYRWASEFDFPDYELSITDIGGNANRHLSSGRLNVHSCNPILDPADATRRLPENYSPGASYCGSKSIDCPAPNPDVYMAVHSLYYLTPQEVLEHVHKANAKRLYAAVHVFDDLYGQYHGNSEVGFESTYQCYAKGSEVWVTMQVSGNSRPYQHNACFWLKSGYYSSGGKAMAWEGKQKGDTWLFKFAPAKVGLETVVTPPMSLIESIHHKDHYGQIDGVLSYGDSAEFRPMMEFLKVHDCEMYSICGHVWLRQSSSRMVMVPKHVVTTVANELVGAPRDKAALRKAVAVMRNVTRRLKMPPQIQSSCLTYGVALAFVCHLNDEIGAFSSLLRPRWQKAYKRLVSVLSLENIVCCAGHVEDDEVVNATTIAYAESRCSVPSQPFDAAKAAWFGVECGKPLVKRRPGSRISNVNRDPIDDKSQLYPVAVTFSNYIPVVPYSSPNNEVLAVNNRALMDTPVPGTMKLVVGTVACPYLGTAHVHDPMDDVLQEVSHWIDRFNKVEDITPEDVEKYFTLWNMRFPPARANTQRKVWREVMDRGHLEKRDFVFDMFVKRELTLKGGPEFQDFDPRAIQSPSTAANVVTGPFFYQFSKRLCKVWNSDSHICYTSGMNGEEIGAWRAQFGDEPVTILEIDESRYDAHMGKNSYDVKLAFYEAFGFSDWPMANEAYEGQRKKVGYGAKGVKYSVDYTVGSGQPDTSCGNSLWNGLKVSAFLNKQGLAGRYKVLVHGDDSLVVIRGQVSQFTNSNIAYMKKTMVEYNKALGFDVKVKVHQSWAQAEYCSSLFWPVLGGYVLGAKPGRQLVKMGWSLNKLDAGQTKGMLLGAKLQYGFVPVLRTYVGACLGLCKSFAAKRFTDGREVYKSMITSRHLMTDDTIDFFMDRYDCHPGVLEEELLDIMRGADGLTTMVDWPGISSLLDVDL